MKAFLAAALARLIGAGVGLVAAAAAHKVGWVTTPDQQAAAVVAVYGVIHNAVPKLIPPLNPTPGGAS
jgi:hypothetical protein